MPFYNRTVAADVELKSGSVLRIENLRVKFQIEKTSDSTANKAEIEITNLSRDTRSRIREKDALIRLFAGYTGDLGAVLLFTGNAQRIVTDIETPDIVTKIEAQDGQRTLRESRTSFSYGDRTSVNTIVNRLANELGIPLRQDFSIPGFYNGYSFNGRAKDGLDAICRNAGYEWSVQDNEIQIIPVGGNTGQIAVNLTPETGLVNEPERLADQEGELEEALEKELEWRITSLLNPRLTPGGLVNIESQITTGVFTVEKVRHYGDSRGKEWYSEIEVKPR